jgi:DNA processing protein
MGFPAARATDAAGFAREFARALARDGLTIVSGLALGIDAAAHEGALDTEASTIAVVGTGPDRVYPARNRGLAQRIAERGLVVSEYLPGTPARKEHFPQRNRLISGLARGVLVVEATLSSGSLITARLAGDQGRDVFAIPGSIHSPFSKGCHKLIREGAKLVETAQDVLDELRGTQRAPSRRDHAPATGARSRTRDGKLLHAMGYDPVTIDMLVARMRVPAESITAELVTLELAGRVSALPGGLWQRIAQASA